MAGRGSSHRLPPPVGTPAVDTTITLWWRWPVLMSAAMPWRDTAELNRMVFEKSAAATAGMIAMQTETLKIAASAVTGRLSRDAAAAIAGAALKPALRTVKANAKRLPRKGLKRRR